MLLVRSSTNVSVILLLRKLYLGNNPREKKAKNYSFQVNSGKKSECPIVGELIFFS